MTTRRAVIAGCEVVLAAVLTIAAGFLFSFMLFVRTGAMAMTYDPPSQLRLPDVFVGAFLYSLTGTVFMAVPLLLGGATAGLAASYLERRLSSSWAWLIAAAAIGATVAVILCYWAFEVFGMGIQVLELPWTHLLIASVAYGLVLGGAWGAILRKLRERVDA